MCVCVVSLVFHRRKLTRRFGLARGVVATCIQMNPLFLPACVFRCFVVGFTSNMRSGGPSPEAAALIMMWGRVPMFPDLLASSYACKFTYFTSRSMPGKSRQEAESNKGQNLNCVCLSFSPDPTKHQTGVRTQQKKHKRDGPNTGRTFGGSRLAFYMVWR